MRRDDELGPTSTAIEQARKRALRAPLLIEMGSTALGAPELHELPRPVVDNAQLGDGLSVPFTLRVLARDALASGWVLEESLPVVDNLSDVELVVEDAIAPLRRAEQCRGVPMPAGGSRHGLAVEVAHDCKRAPACGVLAEDAADDVGLGRIDGTASPVVAVLEHVIAVAPAAGNAASLDTADLAAARLLRQVLEEQRRHSALETDVDLRHCTIGQRLDAHAQELQLLEQRGNVGLAARQAIEALGDDHVEPSGLRIRDQAQAGPAC